MKTLNEITLLGYVGKAPEKNETSEVVRFSVATNRKTKSGVDITDWHNIVCFGKLGEIAMSYVKKGSLILVKGSVTYGQYEKNGVKMYTTSIFCNDITMFPKGTSKSAGEVAEKVYSDVEKDDVPF